MRTAGLMMNDVWASRVLNARGVEAYQYEGQEADIGVFVDQIDLVPHGRSKDGAPYIHISGELQWIEPLRDSARGQKGLPFGIDRVTYGEGSVRVDGFYEFDRAQYTKLVADKGYFTGLVDRSQQVLKEAVGTPWEFPAIVDSLVVTPEGPDDQPLVFCNVRGIADLPLDLATTGYDFVDLFPDVLEEDVPGPELDSQREARVRTDEIHSLFSEEEVEAAIAPETAPEPEEVADQGVSAELAAVQADIDARAEALHQARAAQEGTTENLYAERVAGVFVPEEDAPAPRRHAFEPIGPAEDGGDGRDYTPGA